jgi:hypothetical protein
LSASDPNSRNSVLALLREFAWRGAEKNIANFAPRRLLWQFSHAIISLMAPKNPTNPTPKKRKRSKGDWGEAFLRVLAETGNISISCARVKISRDAFYYRRNSRPGFAKAVKNAFRISTDALEAEARRRAQEGIEKPVTFKGEPVFVWIDKKGKILPGPKKGAQKIPLILREYSDTLLIFLLKAHRPKKFRERQEVQHKGRLNLDVQKTDEYRIYIEQILADDSAREAAALLSDRICGLSPPAKSGNSGSFGQQPDMEDGQAPKPPEPPASGSGPG